jgi:hypothetical protein
MPALASSAQPRQDFGARMGGATARRELKNLLAAPSDAL